MDVVKLTGAEWAAFMDDKAEWPEGAWFDDEQITVNGTAWEEGWDGEQLEPSDKVVLIGGAFYPDESARTFFDSEAKVRKWLKARNVTILTIEVVNEAAADLKAELKARTGVKVLAA